MTTQSLGSKLAWLKCAADLAVFGLTITNPITFLVAQAAVDGAFALVDAVTDDGNATKDAVGAVTTAGMAGVASGVGKAVNTAVARGLVSDATVGVVKRAGGAVALVGMASVVGYQFYDKGLVGGAKAALSFIIPQSCQTAYASMTEVPHNDVASR